MSYSELDQCFTTLAGMLRDHPEHDPSDEVSDAAPADDSAGATCVEGFRRGDSPMHSALAEGVSQDQGPPLQTNILIEAPAKINNLSVKSEVVCTDLRIGSIVKRLLTDDRLTIQHFPTHSNNNAPNRSRDQPHG